MHAEDVEAVVRAIIAAGESYYAEFKSCWDVGPDDREPREIKTVAGDIGEAIVAFANSDGGDLLVGVEDSGVITGVPFDGDRLLYLLQSPRHQVRTEVGVAVHDVRIDGHRVLLFRVQESPKRAHRDRERPMLVASWQEHGTRAAVRDRAPPSSSSRVPSLDPNPSCPA